MHADSHEVAIHPLFSPWGRFGLFSFYIDAPEPAIVDTGVTGSPAEGMKPALEKLGKDITDVRWILLTHGHIDHIGGAYELWEMTGRKAKVVIHEADVPYLRSRQYHVEQYFKVRDQYIGNPNARQEQEAAAQGAISGEMEPDVLVRHGDMLNLGGINIQVHHIPGHTTGSVGYEVLGQGAVFVGDAVQVHGAANGFPGYEDPVGYKKSLRYLLDEVRPTKLYLGHPYRTTEGVAYGVELDPTETQAALEESLEVAQRVQGAAKAALDEGLATTDSVYSPFEPVAEAMDYSEDPRREPSPFFTTLHGYRQQNEGQ